MKKRLRIRTNLRPGAILMVIPFLAGLIFISSLLTHRYQQYALNVRADHLITDNWQLADQKLSQQQPLYAQKFAYYQLKDGQTLSSVASHFSVPEAQLTALNPGVIVAGTTIRVPPVQSPISDNVPRSNGQLPQVKVTEAEGMIHIRQEFKQERVVTNLPELSNFLAPYGVFKQLTPKSYRLLKPLSIEGNIRLTIDGSSVSALELLSRPHQVTCLCFENADVLIKNTAITSFDPQHGGPDVNPEDSRSFIRAYKSTRLDILHSNISYLGGPFVANAQDPPLKNGGAYGLSWRIPGDTLGQELVTGWVADSDISHNYFGAYTFGASGMTFQRNRFHDNQVYGLDPHDDSNNALIEDNSFDHNGQHGFIASKRCNYNIIRGNKSFANGLHGFMLHESSNYNYLTDNIAYNNTDNFAIFSSNFNSLVGNHSDNPRGSHVRINKQSTDHSFNNFIIGNTFQGGYRGIYLYDGTKNILVKDNTFRAMNEIMDTRNAQNILFVNNDIPSLRFRFANNDLIIFGPNKVSYKQQSK